MYLSRLTINPHSPPALSALSDPYALHQLVWSALPDREDGGPGRVLFRLEPLVSGLPPVLLVQSEREPNWRALVSAGCLVAETKPFAPRFAAGQCLRFRLRANPTVRRVFGGPTQEGAPKPSGTRIGVYGEDAQRGWLDRKAAHAGFKVLECRVSDRGVLQSRKPGSSAPLRHLCVDFEGVLQVTDPGLFLGALQTGLGSGKGLGFGLLSVAPA